MTFPTDTRDRLIGLLGQLRNLAQSEASAIESAHFESLDQLQDQKEKLHRLIEQLEAPFNVGRSRFANDPEVEALTGQILRFDKSNHDHLTREMKAIRGQINDTSQVHDNIRRVHSAYGRTDNSLWEARS